MRVLIVGALPLAPIDLAMLPKLNLSFDLCMAVNAGIDYAIAAGITPDMVWLSDLRAAARWRDVAMCLHRDFGTRIVSSRDLDWGVKNIVWKFGGRSSGMCALQYVSDGDLETLIVAGYGGHGYHEKPEMIEEGRRQSKFIEDLAGSTPVSVIDLRQCRVKAEVPA